MFEIRGRFTGGEAEDRCGGFTIERELGFTIHKRKVGGRHFAKISIFWTVAVVGGWSLALSCNHLRHLCRPQCCHYNLNIEKVSWGPVLVT